MGIKIVGAVMIISAPTMIGMILGDRARDCIKSLESLKRLLVIMRGELVYQAPPIKELLEYVIEYSDGKWCEYFGVLAELINQNEDNDIERLWEVAGKKTGLSQHMYYEDYRRLLRFGKDIGNCDVDSLLKRTDLYIENVDIRINELGREVKDRVKLCRVLGIAFGAFITILII